MLFLYEKKNVVEVQSVLGAKVKMRFVPKDTSVRTKILENNKNIVKRKKEKDKKKYLLIFFYLLT